MNCLNWVLKQLSPENSIESSSQAKITSSDIAHIKTYQDHRMVMSFAPLSLVCDEIIISDIQHVEKSYPTLLGGLEKSRLYNRVIRSLKQVISCVRSS